MPKSKKKNRDFQKVKLKAGKERKQANETDLSFKTRTIKVTQTFKDFTKSDQPQTKKKLTFEEVLKRCDANKTVSQRLSGVEGLRELVLGWEGEISSPRFAAIMGRVSSLFSDPEPAVRQALIRLCRCLIIAVDERCINLNLFSAQLCCAVGHVSDDIRRDALTLFDLVLEKCPEKLVGEFCRLVPALVSQITASMVTSKSGHSTLAINPRSKLSTQSWRAQVLHRLRKVVDTYVSKQQRETAPPSQEEQEVWQCGVEKFPLVRGPCVLPSWKRLWTQWPRHTHGADAQQFAHLASNADQLRKFISSVLPVIRECWIEEFAVDDSIGHSNSTGQFGVQLTEAALPMLKGVVGLLYSLVQCWRCCNTCRNVDQSRWFRREFLQSLRELFLPHFPITVIEKPGKVKKGQEGKKGQKDKKGQEGKKCQEVKQDTSPVQVSVLTLNLTTCELLASFPPGEEDSWPHEWVEPEDWQGEVVTFLLRNFKRSVQAGLSSNLGRVLRLVFLHYPCSDRVEQLLVKAQRQFLKAHPLSSQKAVLLDMLDHLAFDVHRLSPYHAQNMLQRHSHALLTPYLESVPLLVLQLCSMGQGDQGAGVGDIAVRACRAMGHTSSSVLTQAVLAHMTQLLDDQTGVFAVLPQSCQEAMLLALSCAFHSAPVSEAVLRQMELIIRHPRVDSSVSHRLLASVAGRFHEFLARMPKLDSGLQKQVHDSKMAYLSFLFSSVVGHRAEELSAMAKDDQPGSAGLTRMVWTCSLQHLQKQAHTCTSIFQYFNDFFETSRPDMSEYGVYTLDTMSDVWNEKILQKYQSLSVVTVWGALKHWQFMVAQSHMTDGEDLHLDGAPAPLNWAQPEQYQRRVEQYMPVFKSRMRPFTRLAFSLIYGIVVVESGAGGEEPGPAEGMVEELWKAVVELMGMSLRLLIDLILVATQFVQETNSEQNAMRATMGLTRLLAETEVHALKTYSHGRLPPLLHDFQTAVQVATAGVQTDQWWRDFSTTCVPFIASTGADIHSE